MKLHKQAHVVYKAQYHIVWITRYRRKILVPGIATYFATILKEVRKFHPDWYIEEVGTDLDHVHPYMIIPPRYAVSNVVAAMKANTSARIREKFSHFLSKVYLKIILKITGNMENKNELKITGVINVPIEKVFKAWTDKNEIEKWYGPEGMETKVKDLDFKVGGRYRFAMTGEGGTPHRLRDVQRNRTAQ